MSTWTALRGRAHVSRAWSEEEVLSKEISREDSIPSSSREGEDSTRLRTVDIWPSGECRVATSGPSQLLGVDTMDSVAKQGESLQCTAGLVRHMINMIMPKEFGVKPDAC